MAELEELSGIAAEEAKKQYKTFQRNTFGTLAGYITDFEKWITNRAIYEATKEW